MWSCPPRHFQRCAPSALFPSSRASEPWSTDAQIRKTLWQPVCKRAEVEYRNPYQVRHTYASALLTAGATPWYVTSQLGHEDVEMVFRTCGKFIRDDYQKPKPEFRIVGEKRSVRNRCDLMDTTGHQKAKKNRHTLGFPVCGGVLNGGAGGN